MIDQESGEGAWTSETDELARNSEPNPHTAFKKTDFKFGLYDDEGKLHTL